MLASRANLEVAGWLDGDRPEYFRELYYHELKHGRKGDPSQVRKNYDASLPLNDEDLLYFDRSKPFSSDIRTMKELVRLTNSQASYMKIHSKQTSLIKTFLFSMAMIGIVIGYTISPLYYIIFFVFGALLAQELDFDRVIKKSKL